VVPCLACCYRYGKRSFVLAQLEASDRPSRPQNFESSRTYYQSINQSRPARVVAARARSLSLSLSLSLSFAVINVVQPLVRARAYVWLRSVGRRELSGQSLGLWTLSVCGRRADR